MHPQASAECAGVGRELGRYCVLMPIARGGMGAVSLAVFRGFEDFRKLVAIKELRGEYVGDPALVAMFMDEARLAAQLNHPNVVSAIEVGMDDGRPFLAMEYLEGHPLRELTQRALAHATRIPLRVHLGVVLDVLSALEYAHGLAGLEAAPLGVVHRDVSPHNVVVTYEGQVKLIDFGSSKSAGPSQSERPEVITGKTRYMAPEQARGADVDRRADIFSVGVMLWEAIVGRRPWEGQSQAAVVASLARGAVPRVRDDWPDVDPGLGAIVEQAMSADPSDRFPTALSMRVALEHYMEMRGLAHPSARSLGASVARLFANERADLRASLDVHLRALQERDAPRSAIRPRAPSTAPGAQPRVWPEAPDQEAQRTTLASPVADSSRSGSFTPGHTSSVGAGLTSSAEPSPAADRGGSRGALTAIGAALVGAVLAVGVLSATRLRPAYVAPNAVTSDGARAARDVAHQPAILPTGDTTIPRAAPAAPTSAPPAVVTAPEPPRTSRIIVLAAPSWAHVYLDEVLVPNPFIVDHSADSAPHWLRVEAPGYEPKSRAMTFATDIQVDVELAPSRVSRAQTAKVEPPPAVASAPRQEPAFVAVGTKGPLVPKPIETSDPYAGTRLSR